MAQKILVAVGGPVFVRRKRLGRRQLEVAAPRLEAGIKAEVRGQHEGSAVIAVISVKKVRDRGLRRSGLDRRMRIDDACRSEKSRIRDSVDANLPIIVGHILQQPFDGVVGICALINVFRRTGTIELRGHIDKASLRLIPTANVLKYKDVPSSLERLGLPQPGSVMILAVGSDTVRRARHQERVWMRGILGDIYGGKQMNAVARRYPVLVLGVVRSQIERLRLPFLSNNDDHRQHSKADDGRFHQFSDWRLRRLRRNKQDQITRSRRERQSTERMRAARARG